MAQFRTNVHSLFNIAVCIKQYKARVAQRAGVIAIATKGLKCISLRLYRKSVSEIDRLYFHG